MAFAMAVTLLGFVLLLEKLDIIGGEVWAYFWPLLLIFWGLYMMFNKMQYNHYFDDCCVRGDHHRSRRRNHRASKK